MKSNVIPNQLADTWARSILPGSKVRGCQAAVAWGERAKPRAGKAWGGSDRSCPEMHPAERLGGGVIVTALCYFQMMGNGWDPEPQLTGGTVAVGCAMPCCAMGIAGAMLPGQPRAGALLPSCVGAELSHASRQPRG